MDDLEGFHSRKLGRLNFENSLVEKLVLTESLGIEMWEIFHSLKSSKLRPHFKTVFFNGSFATQANFDTLKKFMARQSTSGFLPALCRTPVGETRDATVRHQYGR
jgi:hypothetical protein